MEGDWITEVLCSSVESPMVELRAECVVRRWCLAVDSGCMLAFPSSWEESSKVAQLLRSSYSYPYPAARSQAAVFRGRWGLPKVGQTLFPSTNLAQS